MKHFVTRNLQSYTSRRLGLFFFMTCISAFDATATQNSYCQDRSDGQNCSNVGQFQHTKEFNTLDVLFQTGGVMKQHLTLDTSSDQYRAKEVNIVDHEVLHTPKQKLISQQVVNKILFALDESGSQHLIRCSALTHPEVHSYLKNAIYKSEALKNTFLTSSNSTNVSFSKTECKKFLELVLR